MTWVRTDAVVDSSYEDQDEFMLALSAELVNARMFGRVV